MSLFFLRWFLWLWSVPLWAQSSIPSGGIPSEVVAGEYIIKYKSLIRPGEAAQKLQGKAALKASFAAMNMYHISLKTSSNMNSDVAMKAVYEDLKNDPTVEYIEPNYVLRLADDGVVNQTLGKMSFLDVTGSSYSNAGTYSQSTTPVHVTEAWSVMSPPSSSNKVVVAVIDTGIDLQHDVFKPYNQGGTGALWVNPREIPGNGIDDDFNGYVDDVNGWNFSANNATPTDDQDHGTHVSGIIVGTSMDVLSTPIGESKIVIMPLKFLAADGSGSTANAIKAIYYAVNNGAKVINNSWGGPSYSRSLHEAFTFAYDHQVLLVNAAGNYSKDNDGTTMYPANYDIPSSLAVAAVNSFDNLASFSNYGFRTVEIAAPGVGILSTIPGGFGTMSGTSMAAPFISGVAALITSESPQLTGYQIKQLLLSTSEGLSQLNNKVSGGRRVQVLNALTQAKLQVSTPPSQPAYTPNYTDEPRSLASSDGSGPEMKTSGCGMVALMKSGLDRGGFGNTGLNPWFLAILFAPVMVWYFLRQRHPASRRKYDRFRMNSEIRIKVGDRELVGSTQTISMGGVSFNVDQALEKGGLVTLQIASPDGNEKIEVQGQIVWNEHNHAYGVSFNESKAGVIAAIQTWSRSLIRQN